MDGNPRDGTGALHATDGHEASRAKGTTARNRGELAPHAVVVADRVSGGVELDAR